MFLQLFEIHDIITKILLRMFDDSNRITGNSINFALRHIETLIEELHSNQIPVQLQSDHDSLGLPLDRRLFVVVDNLAGTVALGPWFSSLLLFIVGYPRKGENKKNHYCANPKQVVQKYQQFCKLPDFAKKSYLCSKITSKSVLKSSRSVISKTLSSCSQSRTERKKMELEQKSKLFLFSSETDHVYNKWILKIAASNPKKFQIIQSQEELKLALTVCRCKVNYLLINSIQHQRMASETMKNLSVILYEGTNLRSSTKSHQVERVCFNQKEIISMLRQIGFQVVSLRDIDKSIVKYGNPFAKQVKSKSRKKLLWGKDSGSENENSDRNSPSETKSREPSSQYCINIKKQEVTDPIAASAPLQSLSSLKNPPDINFLLEKKRSSIESQLEKSGTKRKISKSQWTEGSSILPNKLNSLMIDPLVQSLKPEPNQNTQLKKEVQNEKKSEQVQLKPLVQPLNAPMKIKRIRCYKSLDQKKLTVKSVQSNKKKLQVEAELKLKEPTIENLNKPSQPYIKSDTKDTENSNSSLIGTNLSSKHVLDLSKASQILNEPRNSITISFPESINLNLKSSHRKISVTDQYRMNHKQNWLQSPQNKITVLSPRIMYRKKLIESQQTLLRKKDLKNMREKEGRKLNMEDFVIIWKEFNFNIENSKHRLLIQVQGRDLANRSFYSVQELSRILLNETKPNIVIFLDEVDIEKYINLMKNSPRLQNLYAIYVFEKENKLGLPLIESIRNGIKCGHNRHGPIVRPVRIDDYIDESNQVARDISSWFIQANI